MVGMTVEAPAARRLPRLKQQLEDVDGGVWQGVPPRHRLGPRLHLGLGRNALWPGLMFPRQGRGFPGWIAVYGGWKEGEDFAEASDDVPDAEESEGQAPVPGGHRRRALLPGEGVRR